MHTFHYQDGFLCCENVRLLHIAETVGTPAYVYSKHTILDHFQRLKRALSPLGAEVAYAVKACSNLAILQLMAREGAGFDIVSGGELWRTIRAGGDPGRCTYAGVGKTEDEIRYALEQGIYCFNAESEAELRTIDEIAASMGVKAPVAVRVNPNVEAGTHQYITTGRKENKFGVDFDRVEALYAAIHHEMPSLIIRGLQMHIGSQLTSIEPFVQAVNKVAPMAARLRELYGIEFFSIGGGIGIVYDQPLPAAFPAWWESRESRSHLHIETYAERLIPLLKPLGLRIIVEPGRMIVGNAGVLLAKCLYEKKGESKTFKIVDAGMNDLIRPALYQGHHEIVPLVQHGDDLVTADVAGPICESGDFQAQNRPMHDIRAGEYLAVLSAGAYGFSMSSNYNSRPMAAEVLVDGGTWTLIRARQTLEDLVRGEILPE